MNELKSHAYINGEWIKKEKTFAVSNPYNGDTLAHVSDCEQEDARHAIDAAYDAFKVWSKYTASKRSKILKRWYQLQKQHVDRLAEILTKEQGKPLQEAKGEVLYGASFVEWFAEEAKRVYGDVIPGHSSDKRITVIKQPIGVVAAITPWNFPNAMITRKISPALAAGCTVVLKPSEYTPLSALALADLAEQAGFPSGVINIVTASDPKNIGEEFTSNPKVKKLSFTGSTRVGKYLLKASADQVKKVSLELGGNAPFIVFEDADIEQAANGCIASKFRNAGQTCICTNRIFVHECKYDQFVQLLSEKMQELKLGNGMEPETNIGPMINEAAVVKDEKLIEQAKSNGAKIMIGGSRKEKLLFSPTLICDLDESMDIYRSEIFGPIAAVYQFSNEEEVIQQANDTNYGLAAYFFGKDYARIWRVAEALDFGMIGINTTQISSSLSPFGGVKESGFGREGSKYGIQDYLNIKSMVWGGVK